MADITWLRLGYLLRLQSPVPAFSLNIHSFEDIIVPRRIVVTLRTKWVLLLHPKGMGESLERSTWVYVQSTQ